MKTKIHTLKKSSALIVGALAGVSTTHASGDYGPAHWVPNCGQYYTSGNGHKFVVMHDMEGYYASSISYFQNCGTSTSIHYCVNGVKDATSDSPAGDVTQMVSESNYAWHVCCWNTYCHGTEHEGFASNPAWFTDAMYNATGDLQQHLCNKFNIATDRNHVVGHNAKSVAGWPSWASANLGIDPYCNTHQDPGPYWDWSKLMGIVNGNTSQTIAGPDAVSWVSGGGRIDVVARGTGNDIMHKIYDGNNWLGYNSIGGNSSSGPSICSWANGRLDVFTRGSDDSLMHQGYIQGTGWLGWQNLGGNLEASPDAVSWGSGRIDVVVRANGNNIQHIAYHDGAWDSWQSMGGGDVASAPSICSWASGRLDVFYRGTDNALHHQGYNGSWLGWQNLGGNIIGGPDSVSWGSGRIDVFARGPGNDIMHRAFHDGAWDVWQSLGGNAASDPGASSTASGRLDVFYVDSGGTLWRRRWDGTNWLNWQNLGGNLH